MIFLRRRRLQRGKEGVGGVCVCVCGGGGGGVRMELDGLDWMEATFKL